MGNMTKLMEIYMKQGKGALNREERVELAQEMLELRISEIYDMLGVPFAHSGSIEPKYYKRHEKLGAEPGLKIRIYEENWEDD
jgi:hypothetical protein